jgi:hypothetical protein
MVEDKKDVKILPKMKKHKTKKPFAQEQLSIKDIPNVYITMEQIDVAEVSKF